MAGLESSALYFNAMRTAGLMTLISYAIVLVMAPVITRHYYAGDRFQTQLVTAAGAWAGFAFAVCTFGLFVLFGEPILSLFGPVYGDAHLVLVLLSAGLLVDAATGPTLTLMTTTGQERVFAYSLGAVTLVSLVIQALVLPTYGLVGVAAGEHDRPARVTGLHGLLVHRKGGGGPHHIRCPAPTRHRPAAPELAIAAHYNRTAEYGCA
jgi:O-antigen/teichoic acid export membrane protein